MTFWSTCSSQTAMRESVASLTTVPGVELMILDTGQVRPPTMPPARRHQEHWGRLLKWRFVQITRLQWSGLEEVEERHPRTPRPTAVQKAPRRSPMSTPHIGDLASNNTEGRPSGRWQAVFGTRRCCSRCHVSQSDQQARGFFPTRHFC